MDSDQTSRDLLSHFDRPKTLSPDEVLQFQNQPPAPPGVCRTRAFAPPTKPPTEPGAASAAAEIPSRRIRQRDIRWTLKWAAALAVIAIAATQLTAFVCLCEAQHALNLAARAGASESILPRASYDTICRAIERRLATYPQLGSRLQVTLLQNGRPIGRRLKFGEEDRISVTISAPASALTPSWLAKLPQWKGDALISAMADRTMPSHKLRPQTSQDIF